MVRTETVHRYAWDIADGSPCPDGCPTAQLTHRREGTAS
jgi:hypothetical protein